MHNRSECVTDQNIGFERLSDGLSRSLMKILLYIIVDKILL